MNKLDTDGSMPKLRILRISGNRLQELNAASFPNLRTLYADSNSLVTLVKLDRLSKLENLSLRNQRGRGLYVDGIGDDLIWRLKSGTLQGHAHTRCSRREAAVSVGYVFCEGVGQETEELRRECHQERIL